MRERERERSKKKAGKRNVDSTQKITNHVCVREREREREVKKSRKKKRRQQGSNLRGRSPTDFKSVSLTTRAYRRFVLDKVTKLIYTYNRVSICLRIWTYIENLCSWVRKKVAYLCIIEK